MLTPKARVEKASPQNSPMASESLLPRNSKPRSALKMSLLGTPPRARVSLWSNRALMPRCLVCCQSGAKPVLVVRSWDFLDYKMVGMVLFI